MARDGDEALEMVARLEARRRDVRPDHARHRRRRFHPEADGDPAGPDCRRQHRGGIERAGAECARRRSGRLRAEADRPRHREDVRDCRGSGGQGQGRGRAAGRAASSTAAVAAAAPIAAFKNRYDLLVIGVSTGGPQGLKSVIPRLPADFPCRSRLSLHMPIGYTEAARRGWTARSSAASHAAARSGADREPALDAGPRRPRARASTPASACSAPARASATPPRLLGRRRPDLRRRRGHGPGAGLIGFDGDASLFLRVEFTHPPPRAGVRDRRGARRADVARHSTPH